MRYETYKQKSKLPISQVRVSYDMYRCATFYYSLHSPMTLLLNRNWFHLSSTFFLSCKGEKISGYKRSEKEVRWPCGRMLGFQGARFKKKVKQITLSSKNQATKNWISNERVRKSCNDQCRDWESGRDSRRLCWRPTS